MRPSRISRCCDLQLQRNINQSPRIQGGVAILANHRNFPANLTNQWRQLELTSTNYLPSYFRVYYVQAIQAFMQHMRVQRFTLADQNNCERSRKAVSCFLHESGGNLFCTACNIVVEHEHKSSIDNHFATAKHNCRTAGRMSDDEADHYDTGCCIQVNC